ncbi:MAG: bifunctional adenosylcobinamide kinase/adenosylcobinamide-phosphate guanylyltransferase, partial [Chloroflexota bacterium]
MIPPDRHPGSLTLITGGARGGKSAQAEKLVRLAGGQVVYVATAEAGDDEMRTRIAAHKAARPASWHTIEEPLHPSRRLAAAGAGTVLLDCLTLLVSNLLLAGEAIRAEIDALLAWQRASGATLVVVSNEVGWGIVPDNPLARRYQDELGWANQRVAAAANDVVLM